MSLMVPLLLGTAAFGIAKLAGASTKTSLLAGLGTFGGLAAFQSMAPQTYSSIFGKGALSGSQAATGGLTAQGTGMNAAFRSAVSASTPELATAAGTTSGLAGTPIVGSSPAAANYMVGGQLGDAFAAASPMAPEIAAAAPAVADVAAAPTLAGKIGNYISENPGTSLAAGVAAANLLGSAMAEDPMTVQQAGQAYPEADYAAAKARQDAAVEGMSGRYPYDLDPAGNRGDIYNPVNPIYANQGGLISFKNYSEGGINYLPSKSDHDENDSNNYVRAMGYVEDGSGNGDKDEDTMLAQLADGEFVSRADAILGAGIMSGANPKDMKEMRSKGAKFFYNQQDQLKRIYDIVNDGNKTS